MTVYHLHFAIDLAKAGFLLFLLLTSASAIYALASRIAAPAERTLAAAVSLTIGPFLMAWLLMLMLVLAPGGDKRVYLGVIGAVFALPGVLFFATFAGQLALGARRFFGGLVSEGSVLGAIAALVFAIATLVIILQGLGHRLFIPIWGNDPQEYAQLSYLLAQARSVDLYPVMSGQMSGGLYAPWTHPLGYPMLQVLARFIEGGGEQSFLIGMLTPYFAMSGALVVAAIASRTGRSAAGPIAAFALLATPLYFHMLVQAHIDVSRLAAFTCGFAMVWLVARRPDSWQLAAAAGVAVGMAQYAHSIGFLALPLLMPLLAIISTGTVAQTARNIGIIAAVSLIFVVWRLLTNMSLFGAPLGDNSLVWEIEFLREDDHRAYMRMLYLPFDYIIRAPLRGWSDTALFGYTYWIATALVGIAAFAMRRRLLDVKGLIHDRAWNSDEPAWSAFLVTCGFLALTLLTIAAGTDLIVKNARYLLTVQPFVAILIGSMLSLPLYLSRHEEARPSVHRGHPA